MKSLKNYLITGGTGFIGSHILNLLKNKDNIKVYYTYKDNDLNFKNSKLIGIKINFENLNEVNRLKNIICKIDTIIHCANLAHSKYSPEKIYNINFLSTIQIAKFAKIFNIKKFIFLSTAKINMNYEKIINCENNISENLNQDFYTHTKYKTEIEIRKIFKYSKVKCIILRPALVYGKGVKGNLEKLKVLTKLPFPLPFSNAVEKKSFCSIENLIKSLDIILQKKLTAMYFWFVMI